MNQELFSKIKETAKTKNDGVYSKCGVQYGVKNKSVVLLAEGTNIYQVYGFMIAIGSVEYRFQVRKKLIELLKNI